MADGVNNLNLPFIIKRSPGDMLYDTFLKKTLGYFLPQCLRYVSEVRPVDPIDTIAKCLYKSVDINFYQQEKIRYLRDLERANHMMKQAKNKIISRLPPIVDAAKNERDVLQKLREEELNDLLHFLKNSDDPLDEDITARLNFLADIFSAQRQVKNLLTERAKRFLAEQRLAEIERKEAIKRKSFQSAQLIKLRPQQTSNVMVTVSAVPEQEEPTKDTEDEDDKLSLPSLAHRESKEIDKILEESKKAIKTSSKGSVRKVRSVQSRKDIVATSSSSHARYDVSDYYDSRTEVIRRDEAAVSPSRRYLPDDEAEMNRDIFDYDTESEIITFIQSKKSLMAYEDFDDEAALQEFKDIIDKGYYAITKNGLLAYVSKTLGVIAPKPSKFKPFSTSDKPEEWLKKEFACQSLYDSELYTVCEYGNLDEVYSEVEEISLAEYNAPVIRTLGIKNVLRAQLPDVEDDDED